MENSGIHKEAVTGKDCLTDRLSMHHIPSHWGKIIHTHLLTMKPYTLLNEVTRDELIAFETRDISSTFSLVKTRFHIFIQCGLDDIHPARLLWARIKLGRG